MTVKLLKSRSLSIVKGKVVKSFVANGEVVPAILNRALKSLGRYDEPSLSDNAQFLELRQNTIEGNEKIAKPGKLKLWCLHFELLPQLMWPLCTRSLFQNVGKIKKLILSIS